MKLRSRSKELYEAVIMMVGCGRVNWDALVAKGLGLPVGKPPEWRRWIRTRWGEETEGMTLHWAHVVMASVVAMRWGE